MKFVPYISFCKLRLFVVSCRDAKEGIQEINMLGKHIDKSKGEAEKDGKETDMELQKEKLQSVSYSYQPKRVTLCFFSIHLLWNI